MDKGIQLRTHVLLKLFWIIVLLFSFFISMAQHGGNPNGNPKGLPHTYSKGWYRNAYFQADSGLIFPNWDTMWTPRFVGTVVRRNQSADYWEWSGSKWIKFGGSAGVVSEADPTVPAWVKAITQANISNWNTAYDNYIVSLSFDKTNGVLTAVKNNPALSVSADLDDRYLTSFTESDPTVPYWVKSIPQGDNSNQYLNWNGLYYGPKQIDYSEIANTPVIPTASDDIKNNILVQQNAGFWVSQPSRIDSRLTLGGPLAQHNSAVAPSSPANGWEYYNTTLNSFQDYVNGSWKTRLYTDGAVWAQTAVVQNTGYRVGLPSTIEIGGVGANTTTYSTNLLYAGLTVANTTAATSTIQQNSPAIKWVGQYWNTPTLSSGPAEWKADVITALNNGGDWRLSASARTGVWTELFRVTEQGHARATAFVGNYWSDQAGGYSTSNFGLLNANGSSGQSGGTSLQLSSSGVNFRVISRGSVSMAAGGNNSASHWIIGQMGMSESTVGVHPVFSSFAIKSFPITNGAAETTLASTLYVEGAPTGITPTSGAWAIFAGSSGYSGNIGTTGDIELTDATKGIIMKASGTTTRYRVTLNSTGTAFIFTAL